MEEDDFDDEQHYAGLYVVEGGGPTISSNFVGGDLIPNKTSMGFRQRSFSPPFKV